MKLFLASDGGDSISDIERFVGGLASKKVAYIVTAGNGMGFGAWRRSETVPLVRSKAPKTEIIELENFMFFDVVSKIKQADVVWVGGGQTGYLLYWMRRLELDKLFKTLGNEKIYVGSSAGSMACSKTQHMSELYPGEEEPGASIIPGLGFVDFEILPHIGEHDWQTIKKLWTFKEPLYLLKDGEAITVVDGKVEVLGEKRMIKND